jgi:hypothetical protein
VIVATEIHVVDRVVIEEMGGGVDLEEMSGAFLIQEPGLNRPSSNRNRTTQTARLATSRTRSVS